MHLHVHSRVSIYLTIDNNTVDYIIQTSKSIVVIYINLFMLHFCDKAVHISGVNNCKSACASFYIFYIYIVVCREIILSQFIIIVIHILRFYNKKLSFVHHNIGPFFLFFLALLPVKVLELQREMQRLVMPVQSSWYSTFN